MPNPLAGAVMTAGELSPVEKSLDTVKPLGQALVNYGQAKAKTWEAEQHRREALYELQESINGLAQEGSTFNIEGIIDHWKIKTPSLEKEVEDRSSEGTYSRFISCAVDIVCDPDNPHSNMLVRVFVSPEATAVFQIDNVREILVSGVKDESNPQSETSSRVKTQRAIINSELFWGINDFSPDNPRLEP